MNDLKYSMKISAGLGEEVLADDKREKRISKAAKIIEKSLQENLNYEDIARKLANLFLGKEKL